jgi:hypothetical protein
MRVPAEHPPLKLFFAWRVTAGRRRVAAGIKWDEPSVAQKDASQSA